jgi:hypothetical protein
MLLLLPSPPPALLLLDISELSSATVRLQLEDALKAVCAEKGIRLLVDVSSDTQG